MNSAGINMTEIYLAIAVIFTLINLILIARNFFLLRELLGDHDRSFFPKRFNISAERADADRIEALEEQLRNLAARLPSTILAVVSREKSNDPGFRS